MLNRPRPHLTSGSFVCAMTIKRTAVIIVACLLMAPTAAAEHIARITQVDTKDFPTIRVYVVITDDQGNPIPDNLPVDLALFEDGKLVTQQTLSKGWITSSVLILDTSGSMGQHDKLQKSKEAAIRFIDMSPPEHHIAIIAFSSAAFVIGNFNDSRDTLRSRIRNLAPGGNTALQDGVGAALDLLRNRSGRKVVVALTDGIENASTRFPASSGHTQLLDRAKADGVSVFTIGLGDDVQAEYLKSYEATKGTYLFSPGPNQLRSIFEKTVNLLEAERVLEYTTLHADRDGASERLSVQLTVSNVATVQETSYTKHGVIPHVRGNHWPYFLLLIFLLYAPNLGARLIYILEVFRFRTKHLERVTAESKCLRHNMKDPNVPQEAEFRFCAGDLVINCPSCERAHYVRSWRMNKCGCMREQNVRGSYCYHRILPKWVRSALDFLTEERKDSKRGRVYLCHCAGDKDGY